MTILLRQPVKTPFGDFAVGIVTGLAPHQEALIISNYGAVTLGDASFSLATDVVVAPALIAAPTAEMLANMGASFRPSNALSQRYQSNGVALMLAGSGGGGGGGAVGGGIGGSRTAVTTEVDTVNGGKRLLTETVNGITWTYAYDVLGYVTTITALGGELVCTVTTDGDGFGIESGNYYRGDDIVVTVAQMVNIKAQLIAGTFANARPSFYVRDFASGRALTLEWDELNEGFRGIGGAPILLDNTTEDDAAGAYTGSTAESGARRSITVPAWLVHKTTDIVCQGSFTTTLTNGAKTLRTYLDGVLTYAYAVGTGNATNSARFHMRTSFRNSLSSQITAAPGGGDGNGISSAAGVATSANFSADRVLDLRYILANATDTIRFNTCRVELQN